MSDWNPEKYLAFQRERTRPAIDLANSISITAPQRILDVGCGPGNSTAVLKQKWPNAAIIGIDNSAAMIESAAKNDASILWEQCDAMEDLTHLGNFDVIFSNAAFQWIPEHDSLICKLYNMLNHKGVLAVQVPYTKKLCINKALQETINPKWNNLFKQIKIHSINTIEHYYEIVTKYFPEISLWETRYYHIMQTYQDIIDWYSSTGLRPYIEVACANAMLDEFIEVYKDRLTVHYKKQANGEILFPFNRVFFVAKKT